MLATHTIYLKDSDIEFDIPENLKLVLDLNSWQQLQNKKLRYPLLTAKEYLSDKEKSKTLNFIKLDISLLTEEMFLKIKNDY